MCVSGNRAAHHSNLCTSGYGFDIAQGFVNLGGVVQCAECGCSPGDIVEWQLSTGGNGSWYQARLQQGNLAWVTAEADAAARGGALAEIADPAEQAFVHSLLRPYSIGYWTGLRQDPAAGEPAGGWAWASGTPLKYLNWGAGQPDNLGGDQHFGTMLLNGTWSDFDLDGETYSGRLGIRGWVIEWSADCNGDGIVDFGQVLTGQLADVDANNIPDCCERGVSCTPCPADITGGGSVDGDDLGILLSAWGTDGQGEFDADISNDGIVDGFDLTLMLSAWGSCGP